MKRFWVLALCVTLWCNSAQANPMANLGASVRWTLVVDPATVDGWWDGLPYVYESTLRDGYVLVEWWADSWWSVPQVDDPKHQIARWYPRLWMSDWDDACQQHGAWCVYGDWLVAVDWDHSGPGAGCREDVVWWPYGDSGSPFGSYTAVVWSSQSWYDWRVAMYPPGAAGEPPTRNHGDSISEPWGFLCNETTPADGRHLWTTALTAQYCLNTAWLPYLVDVEGGGDCPEFWPPSLECCGCSNWAGPYPASIRDEFQRDDPCHFGAAAGHMTGCQLWVVPDGWSPPGMECAADLDGDGDVDLADLADLLGNCGA